MNCELYYDFWDLTRIVTNFLNFIFDSNSFTTAAEMLEDLSVDVPQAFKFMGIYCGALMVDGSITLADLLCIATPLLSSTAKRPAGPKLLVAIFENIKSEHGEGALKEMLSQEKGMVDLERFWPVSKRCAKVVEEWKEVNGLSFLIAKEGNDVGMKGSRLVKKEEAFSSAITLINEPTAF